MNDKLRMKTLKGVVIRKKTLKTIVVKVDRKIFHPLYKKVVVKFTNFHVHDFDDICREGDFVVIRESLPYSKTKSWSFLKIIN